MSATFKYPQALEELQPILYPESDADTQKAKENSDKAQKDAKDSKHLRNMMKYKRANRRER